MTSLQSNGSLLAVLGAGLVMAAAAAWWRHRQPPRKWRRVGELGSLWCFPIKSCGAVSLTTAECAKLGLKQGVLRDRVFMVTGLENNFKTARTFPHMTQICPRVEGDSLTLSAPGMETISIALSSLQGKETVQATVWEHTVSAVDCGEEVASWLSRFVLKMDSGCRLVYYPLDVSTRDARPKNKYSGLKSEDTGALPDASSFMVLNASSVDELNTRLPAESARCTPLHFRPNFVVTGGALRPYEEDRWKFVRIGEHAEFECVKPCTRCIFTNIDPQTGVPNKQSEPLKTLKTYRQITDPALRPFTGDSPVLGVHLAVTRQGSVALGDPVFVSE